VRVDIITIFPDYFDGPLTVSLIGKAAARGDIGFAVHDLRRWATDVHHTVDDTPFGGGPGMVMKADVWGAALADVAPVASAQGPSAQGPSAQGPSAQGRGPRLVVPTPSGVPFTQELAARYAAADHLVFACGRYEGIDSRVAAEVRSRMPVDEVSIGDYVLAGGEAAVAVILEAICRLVPGVLGNESSAQEDSFSGDLAGLLEGPVYTRPRSWRDLEVPDVLLSGNHAAIARWRRDEALRRTAANRPDLITGLTAKPESLDRRDREVLRQAGFPVD